MGVFSLTCLSLLLLLCAPRAECVDLELILKNMSTKEKLGQLIEPIISDMAMTGPTSGIVDKSKLRSFFAEWGVGHMFAVWSPSGGPWSCSKWADAIRQIQEVVVNEMRKPPIMFSLDSVHGANFIADATIFPHNIGVAATFDIDLAYRRAYVTGKDMRTCGFSGVFQPTADIGLQPMWSRHYETFGDDPYVTSVMTRATQDGLQSKKSMDPANFNFSTNVVLSAEQVMESIMTVAILKHWIGYSVPDSGQDRQVATIPDWMLNQYIMPPFRASLSSNETFGIMINSGWTNNGTGPNKAGHANQALLTELLRKTMQSDAFLLTDFDDIQGLIQRGVASSYREATRVGVSAGVDVSLGPQPMPFLQNLMDLVQSGDIPLPRIDAAVRRVLRAKVAAGLFENPFPFANSIASVGSQEDRSLAQEIIESGVTLLKNDHVLPIAFKNVPRKRILITGPGGNQLSMLSGAWTFYWQGASNEAMFGGKGSTIFQGVKQFLSNESSDWDVQYIQGCSVESITDRDAAISAAARVDYIIVAIGERPCAEMLCGIDSLELPRHQVDFVVDLKKSGKPLILLLIQGRPRYFHRALAVADAVLYLYLPGPEAGLPIAKVLFGVTNPSGRLPFAYPAEPGIPKLRFTRESDPPVYTNQWEFGYGLSFTTFVYSDLTVQPALFEVRSADGPPMVVSVKLTNSGSVRGAETVLLFASAKEPNGDNLSRGFHLKRFAKLSLDAGESVVIDFHLFPVDFRHIISTEPTIISVQIGLRQLHAMLSNFTLVAAAGVSFPLAYPDSIQLKADLSPKVIVKATTIPQGDGGTVNHPAIVPSASQSPPRDVPITSDLLPRGSVPYADVSCACSPPTLLWIYASLLFLFAI